MKKSFNKQKQLTKGLIDSGNAFVFYPHPTTLGIPGRYWKKPGILNAALDGASLSGSSTVSAPMWDLPRHLSGEGRQLVILGSSLPIRFPILAQEALLRACAFLPENRIGLRIRILTLLPSSSPERPCAGNLDREELAVQHREIDPALAQTEICFVEADAQTLDQTGGC
jgi:hypothetical protein